MFEIPEIPKEIADKIAAEGDYQEFKHCGYVCILKRIAESLHWCGYVVVGRDHPLYEKNLSSYADLEPGESHDVELSVHGGLTYSDAPHFLDDNSGKWAFGFDCAHCDDWSAYLPRGIYRDKAYVEAQVKGLAEQVKSYETERSIWSRPRRKLTYDE